MAFIHVPTNGRAAHAGEPMQIPELVKKFECLKLRDFSE
jgi:hypothetical protein